MFGNLRARSGSSGSRGGVLDARRPSYRMRHARSLPASIVFLLLSAGVGKAEPYFLRRFDADRGTELAAYFDGVPINLCAHA